MSEEKIGFGNPPRATQFKPGQSGNPAGRPPKTKKAADVVGILNEPVQVRAGGAVRRMTGFEVSLRALARKALKDSDVQAAIDFLRICEKYGLIAVAVATHPTHGVLVVPLSWDRAEWWQMFNRHGPPPWPGRRSGLCGSANE